jgi:hypothetical protein
VRAWQRKIRKRHEPTEPTNTTRLERWLGAENVARVSEGFKDWFGPPVALGGVPGNVYVTAGGEFVGPITAGAELSAHDYLEQQIQRDAKLRFFRDAHRRHQSGAFANLSAVLAAYTGGKGSMIMFNKVGVASSATGAGTELWTRGNMPVAGSAGGAAPGGTATTNSTTGHWGFKNAVTNANTSHHIGGWVSGGTAGNNLLIVDQLFRVAKTASSSGTEAVTGTFSRYQSSTATNPDYIGGNFCYPGVVAGLSATAHNWTVCQYTNQAGSTGQSFASLTGVSSAATGTIDAGAGVWFFTPASGDVGVKALTQMQCSSASVTGSLDFVVAHPIAMYVLFVANQACLVDALTTAVDQLTNVYDNACITGIEILKPATTAVTYSGQIKFCSE